MLIYVPYWYRCEPSGWARGANAPGSLRRWRMRFGKPIWSVDRGVPVPTVRALGGVVADSVANQRFEMDLLLAVCGQRTFSGGTGRLWRDHVFRRAALSRDWIAHRAGCAARERVSAGAPRWTTSGRRRGSCGCCGRLRIRTPGEQPSISGKPVRPCADLRRGHCIARRRNHCLPAARSARCIRQSNAGLAK